jgi:hypothetical protein
VEEDMEEDGILIINAKTATKISGDQFDRKKL